MPFVSIAFIAFAGAVLIAYFLAPKHCRWIVLLVSSYTFYWLYSEWLLLVMFGQTLVTFACGRAMSSLETRCKSETIREDSCDAIRANKAVVKKRTRGIMWLGILVNVLTLLFLKYYNFFADNANLFLDALGVHFPSLGLLLPVGISFYTLQAIAYLSDVQHGKTVADKNIARFMLFMSFFPQIVQGPIPRHKHLALQLYEGHDFDSKRAVYGVQLALWGFSKKMVIADRLAIPVNQVFDNYLYYDGGIVFLAVAFYGLQVYADFSGGVDIARGYSQMLGIDLEENFRQPYFTKSIAEFWRRWHITLGGWMRDYVFYPLSLSKPFMSLGRSSRKVFGANIGKKIPPFVASFIVFFLVGFWHGANWTYIAYGIWNAMFIMTSVLFEDRYKAMLSKMHINTESFAWRLFQMVRSFFICSYGRFFSRAATLSQSLYMMRATVIGFAGLTFFTDGSLLHLGLDVGNWVCLFTGLTVLAFVDVAHEKGFSFRDAIAQQPIVFRWLVYLAAIFIPLVFGVYGGGYDAASFIYQQY